jgi:predicted permease
VGLLLFFTGIQLPNVVIKTLGYIKELNTPLAMFTVGVYLAQTDIKKMFFRRSLYAVSGVRLLVVPAIVFLLMWLVPQAWYDMKLALLIAAACPVGSNVAVYAQLHGKDYPYAVETVIVSTLLSIVTIPVMTSIAQLLW